MPSTQDFADNLLDKENVVAVEYFEDGTVEVLVSEKKPRDQLRAHDVVAENVPDGQKTNVEEAGEIKPELLDPEDPPIEAFSDRHTRHRPVRAGVSEIHADSSAATSGHYPAKVTDPTKGNWSGVMSEGTLVRLSNCHSYARSGRADLGDSVIQPSSHDGGDADDVSGGLAGWLPLEDGVRADVAARTTTPETDSDAPHKLPDEWPTGIRRTRVEKGETLTKTGRTTGVTEGTVQMTNASVNVSYPHGTVRLDDQIITSDMSTGGDSGSSVFDSDGRLVGLLFAGSSRVTVHNRVTNVEDDFGVQYMSEGPDTSDHEPEMQFEEYVETLLHDEYGEANVFRQHTFSTGKRADFVVVDADHDQLLCYELENSAGDLWASGQGQANGYAANATVDLGDEDSRLYAAVADRVENPQDLTTQPVLCFPAGHIYDDERLIYDQLGLRLWEVDTPEDVGLSGV